MNAEIGSVGKYYAPDHPLYERIRDPNHKWWEWKPPFCKWCGGELDDFRLNGELFCTQGCKDQWDGEEKIKKFIANGYKDEED